MVLGLQYVGRMQTSAIVLSAWSAIVAAGCSDSGGGDLDTDPGVPKVDTRSARVTIDGQPVAISGFVIFNFEGVDNVVIKFSGTGIPVGSDLIVSSTHVGAGCDNTMNFITYRPMSAPQYMPQNTLVDPTCGLTIDAISADGGRSRGSFYGTLYSINSSPQTTRVVAATFDVAVPQ